MSASLVGSEMCIRDRVHANGSERASKRASVHRSWTRTPMDTGLDAGTGTCLLYTSDAADDM
eukprot:6766130-Alexandrium_andersonii.AAC.1